MMDQLPYGANILIESTSSNLSEKYDIGRPDFITSKNKITEIIYKYTEINGNLISISTNLDCTLDTENQTFTLSNNTIFGTGEKPYIELHCNNVKIYTTFTDHDGTGNKWKTTDTSSNVSLKLNGAYSNNYAEVAKYCTVSWNKSSEQTIFINKNTSGGHVYSEYYACDAYYLYLDGNTVKQGSSTVWSISGQAPNGKVTIPRLDGVSSSLKHGNTLIDTKNFYKYFVLALQVKIMDGYSIYQAVTQPYIENENKIYDNTGFDKTINNTISLSSKNGIPVLLQNSELEYKWNSDFFYTTSNNEYISPSTSKIKYTWNFSSQTDPDYCSCDCNYCSCDCNYCSCDCNYCSCDCNYCSCDCNYNSGERVYAQNRYNGGATGDKAAMDSSGFYYRTGETKFVSSGWYTVIGYTYDGDPVISGPTALTFYSWDGSDY